MKPAPAATLQIDHQPHRVAIRRPGDAEPLLVQRADAGRRPFIHPIRCPDGEGTLTEDEPAHHRWQHGLYVGLNDVNGVGFWTEGLTGSATDGTIHPEPLAAPRSDGEAIAWEVRSSWRAPDCSELLVETQRWRLANLGDRCHLDCAWSLSASVDLAFGEYAYGGFFLRMPFRKDCGGAAMSSEGAAPDQLRARWVAVAMAVPDRASGPCGIAVLDHPANPVHPTPWRVDWELGVGPSRCVAGAWRLVRGKTTTSRYRFLIHAGASDRAAIEAAWHVFAKTAANTTV